MNRFFANPLHFLSPFLRIVGINLAIGFIISLLCLHPSLAQVIEPTAKLPTLSVLSKKDQTLYRKAFILQKNGQWQEADHIISQIEDKSLFGYLSYIRYMHPSLYISKYSELTAWLENYSDLPNANTIYKLALRKKGNNKTPPPIPTTVTIDDKWIMLDIPPAELLEINEPKLTNKQKTHYSVEANRERQKINRMVQDGNVTQAYQYLESKNIAAKFNKSAMADQYGILARGYYHYQKDALVVTMMEKSDRLDPLNTEAKWWAGLASWRSGNYEQAALIFDDMAYHETDSERLDAAAFWASRAWLRAERPQKVRASLSKVSPMSRNFYGLLALRASGLSPQFNWDLVPPAVSLSELYSDNSLWQVGFLRRALALKEIGQDALSKQELDRGLAALSLIALYKILFYTDRNGYADITNDIARILAARKAIISDSIRYPLPGWQPINGYTIDRALVFAFVRQESRYGTHAESVAGARGLMQLMPATARYIGNLSGFKFEPDQLFDPSINLALGQSYLNYLIKDEQIGGNLFFMAVGYNAGPGNLQKWRNSVAFNNDPLLFIESLPSRETRNFIEHILANLWIYRYRLNQATPSLDYLLGGSWPIYVDLENVRNDPVKTVLLPALAE